MDATQGGAPVHIDWNLSASIATLAVITAAAVAAIIQLSHLRVNNQLQAC